MHKSVEENAELVVNGGPADVAVMVTAAKAIGIKLKIVDNKDYKLTAEDINNNVKIIYIEHNPNNQIGHAFYMDRNSGKFTEADTAGFDCFFGAISESLMQDGINKDISQLREETAKYMRTNSSSFLKIASAQDWIRTNHPQAANNILFLAGLKDEKENEKDEPLFEDIKEDKDEQKVQRRCQKSFRRDTTISKSNI